MNHPEIALREEFSQVRYAQCWEDADVLLSALDVRPGNVCLSIASAGDNTLAMLTRHPGKVVAIDISAAQLACLKLRVAAYRALSHGELLELLGSSPSCRRLQLYRHCRKALEPRVREFWDARAAEIEAGLGAAGRFERYLALFRRHVLPLAHSRRKIQCMLRGGNPAEREAFFHGQWDTWRWRLLFRCFFSRWVMGRLGRAPSFFRYVQGSVAARLLDRTRYALTELDPGANPYLQWICTGRHLTALPFALRPENFEAIRDNLDRLETRCVSLEELVAEDGALFDRFNLSDVFEYMSCQRYERLLAQLAKRAMPGARLVYWNLLAPRSRPESMAAKLRPLPRLARRLHRVDNGFFYAALVIEEMT